MATISVSQLTELVALLESTPGFADLVRSLESGNSGTIDGAWGSASALAAAALAERCSKTLIVVLPRPADCDEYIDDLQAFLGRDVDVFPAWDTLPQETVITDSVFGRRLRTLRRLQSNSPPNVVVTTIVALMQPVPARAELVNGTRRLGVGDTLDQNEFQAWLTSRGFELVTGIQLPGEFAVRGGIIDLYPPDREDPLRIEFFGDEI